MNEGGEDRNVSDCGAHSPEKDSGYMGISISREGSGDGETGKKGTRKKKKGGGAAAVTPGGRRLLFRREEAIEERTTQESRLRQHHRGAESRGKSLIDKDGGDFYSLRR